MDQEQTSTHIRYWHFLTMLIVGYCLLFFLILLDEGVLKTFCFCGFMNTAGIDIEDIKTIYFPMIYLLQQIQI